MRALALIDGEHYPPVVRAALGELALEYQIVGAAFVGGTEKVDDGTADEAYGVPVVVGRSALSAVAEALERFAPDVVVDLSDEPVVSAADRFALASVVLGAGAAYRGADFSFEPPVAEVITETPTLAIVGTGKRVGKTAVSAFAARHLKSSGRDIVVVAMGRGGPAAPELIRGDEVALTTPDLLALARQGVHAASDNYEDAVMSRVTTVGCRRCGGGLAGKTYFSNVAEGARLADSLGKELIVLEGSGAAVPPVHADATLLVVGASQGIGYVRDYFGPYRLNAADAVIIAGAEESLIGSAALSELVGAVRALREDIPVGIATFRPRPIDDVEGARVFFASTASPAVLPALVAHLEAEFGCRVVASSPHLSNRALLREDLRAHAGDYDVLLTELKAAAIDVVAAEGEAAGVKTVLCDNEPLATDGDAISAIVDRLASLALARHGSRST